MQIRHSALRHAMHALPLALAACGSSGAGAPNADATDAAPPARDADAVDAGATDGAPPGPPDCRGTALPAGDVTLGADGRSLDLACGAVHLALGVIDPGTVRVRRAPAADASAPRASYAVVDATPAGAAPRFGSTAAEVRVCTDALLVTIDRASCRVRAVDAAGHVVVDEPDGAGWSAASGGASVARALAPGEHLYGFGEKTGALDKRGRVLTFWNTDAYVAQYGGYPADADPLYQSIPFWIGLRDGAAYGAFVDDPGRLVIDAGHAAPDRLVVASATDAIDEYIFAGPRIADVLRRYTQLTGRAPIPPLWSLGYHQSRWGYAPDAKVLAIASELRARSIPADAVWLDIQHMDGFRSWTWDPANFPDPNGMIAQLAASGFHAVSIVDPGIKVDAAWDVYQSGLAQSAYLAGASGPYVGKVWPGDAVFPDFTAPAARAWWATLAARDVARGVSGLWIDMNEPSDMTTPNGTVPDALVCAGDGAASTMGALHNAYGLEEARATYDAMRAAAPTRRPFVLTRAGYAGIQRYAAAWTGDAPSTWPTLRTTLPMMLGMGLSGTPFVGSDVGGYSGSPGAELFARWIELGSISPFFRVHVAENTPDQEPWAFGSEVEVISRGAIGARYRLLPYVYSLFAEASASGAPVLRPLVYEFQDDAQAATIDDEAMLGPWVLVAPVLDAGATTRSVYLPAGRWFEQRSGAIVEGPTTIQADLTLGAMPTYVREGAILPSAPLAQHTGALSLSPLSVDVYPSSAPTSFTLYEDDGASFDYENGASARTTYTVARTASGATIDATRDGAFAPPSRSVVLRVRRVDHAPTAARVGNQALPSIASYDAIAGASSGVFYDAADLSAVLVVPDAPTLHVALDFDTSIADPAPPVAMPFVVTVPAGTPTTTPIAIATSADGFATQQPLAWGPGNTTASGTVTVPRGKWLFYKYTRGSWATVEKWPGCVEATNRYEMGAAHPVKEDTVFAWADACP